MLDSKGVISKARTDLNEQKRYFATDRTDIHTLEEAIKGADVFLGLSKGNVLSQDMVRSMAPMPIVFALANPTPEISYEDAMAARPDVLMATGRSDYPNQINNVIGFPYIFRGALDTQAKAINEKMKIAAVHAIANLAKQPVPDVVNEAYHVNNFTFGPEYFIPKPVDPRLITEVSCAVARAAMESGVARTDIKDWDAYCVHLRELMGYESKLTRQLYDTARRHPQRVVFAEGIHPNMLKAAVEAKAEGICHPILLGNDEAIGKLAEELDLSLEGIEIVNLRHPDESERRERYARILAEKRAREGFTYEEANDKMFERNYFGMMMVKMGEADGLVSGACHSTGDVLRPCLQILKTAPGVKLASSFFVMVVPDCEYGQNGTFIFSDCGLEVQPDDEALAHIAVNSARSWKSLMGTEPAVAMLSHSSKGSARNDDANKVVRAVEIAHELDPSLELDGELQLDAAIVPSVGESKAPGSRVAGHANVLIFPDLDAGNIGYKLVQRLAKAEAYGPMLQGIARPVNDLSRGCSWEDIVGVVALTAVQAQLM